MIGMRVAQRGSDAATSPDYKMAFSTSWPQLPILKKGQFVSDGTFQVIDNHGLGYVPAFMVFIDNATPDLATRIADGSENPNFGMDENSLAISSSLTAGAKGHYYIFALDIEKNFTAPILETGDAGKQQGRTESQGVRFTQDGKDAASKDLRDFSVHSNTRPWVIHKVSTGRKAVGGSQAIPIPHELGYAPFYLGFVKLDSGAFPSPRYQAINAATTDASVLSTPTQVTFTIGYVGSYSFIVLQDPLV